MTVALTMAILIGIPIGVITAVRQYSKLDYALNSAAIFLASTPVFVLGLIAIYSSRSISTSYRPVSHTLSGRTDPIDAIFHLILRRRCWRSSTPRPSSAIRGRACSRSSIANT